ncbi:MAG: HTH domain-containing protein [Clostridiales bacterium]|nr:HTH domain-containing protein [Clostridiales bacterium]
MNSRSTKDALRALLERNRGAYLSGAQIASELKISRTAIWKAVESLRAEGYEIRSVKAKGYSLAPDTDIVSAPGVARYLTGPGSFADAKELSEGASDLSIEVFDVVGSTNTLLKERAAAGAREGTVIIANSQTGGKGRMGRSFFSPSNTGLYISVLLRPMDLPAERALKITTMAAVSACAAIEALFTEDGDRTENENAGHSDNEDVKPTADANDVHNVNPENRPLIKWVNDIFLRDLKVAGILTEASISMESGRLEYAVLGIGFNVYEPEGGFPKEIRGIAGAILKERIPDAKNRIAAVFLQKFFEIYRAPDHAGYEAEYKARSLVIGKDVDVISTGGAGSRRAHVLDINEDCNLVVRFEDGSSGVLSSGEVSVRPKK